jgi:general secretion pathway protein I
MKGRGPARGFSLLEVMVALAVIATAFVALLGLHARNLRIVVQDEAYTQSILLARDLLSQVELEGLPEVGFSSGDFESRYPGQYPGYRWEQTVTDVFLSDTRSVTVRVIPGTDASSATELTVVVRGRG